ncbi:hypothetical protein R3P38DRAFT_3229634 [Favolaschia claudopus]|uniref:Uncharacterized protein n=1 Tax=Favolaschia claudopus TaxID=2862362 RepID=A0AAV9ZNL4_9AGAR
MLCYPPPLKSQLTEDNKTEYEILLRQRRDRNEKARLRMARKRAERKSLPTEKHLAALERERQYQALYRASHREKLRQLESDRRIAAVHGQAALEAYLKRRKLIRSSALAKFRAKEPYHSGDDCPESEEGVEEDALMSDDECNGSSCETTHSPAP